MTIWCRVSAGQPGAPGGRMTVATTSNTGNEPYKTPDLTKVKPAHTQLMRAYVSILASASLFGRELEPSKNKIYISGLIIRWLVGSHIKRNLMVLGNVYLQLE